MDYNQVKSYLYGLTNYGRSYGIDRMRILAKEIGQLEQSFPVIHVAGTNGKGSVCAMLEAIYRKNGYRTGLFTSPHLIRLEERVQVDRKMISSEELVHYVEYLKVIGDPIAKKTTNLRPSMFEIMNAIAFLYFKKSEIDIGIIETGLGGQFDSTNIVNPEVSVITSISKDHTEILGESLEEIAFAKAGIIKPGKPTVIGLMEPQAEHVIRKIAQEQNSEVFSIAEIFGKNIKAYPSTSLYGTHQKANAAVALLVTRVLKEKFPVDENLANDALMEVHWPGRWQILQINSQKLILDCAHNEGGASVLDENLKLLIQQDQQKPIIIIGSLSLYRAKAILEVVTQYAETIILVKPKDPRALDTQLLKTIIPKEFKGKVLESSVEELFPSFNTLGIASKGRSILATGSIYLIGEILERLKVGPAGFEPATKGL